MVVVGTLMRLPFLSNRAGSHRNSCRTGDASEPCIGGRLPRSDFFLTRPLTDKSVEKSERQARSALFAGAIGSYKNPQSHRDVNLDDPDEVMEIILLANHLLRIVDSRAEAMKASFS